MFFCFVAVVWHPHLGFFLHILDGPAVRSGDYRGGDHEASAFIDFCSQHPPPPHPPFQNTVWTRLGLLEMGKDSPLGLLKFFDIQSAYFARQNGLAMKVFAWGSLPGFGMLPKLVGFNFKTWMRNHHPLDWAINSCAPSLRSSSFSFWPPPSKLNWKPEP